MAASSSTLSATISQRWRRHQRLPVCDFPSATTKRMQFSPSSASFFHHSLFASKLNSWPGRCRATSPGPPPQSESPSNKMKHPSKGIGASFSRLKDTVQIFVAVLFWMSLFFWSSAWDGRNNDRPNKGTRLRK